MCTYGVGIIVGCVCVEWSARIDDDDDDDGEKDPSIESHLFVYYEKYILSE